MNECFSYLLALFIRHLPVQIQVYYEITGLVANESVFTADANLPGGVEAL